MTLFDVVDASCLDPKNPRLADDALRLSFICRKLGQNRPFFRLVGGVHQPIVIFPMKAPVPLTRILVAHRTHFPPLSSTPQL